MRAIMRALCGAWKPEWQGWVMASLSYRRGTGVPSGYAVTVREGRLLRLAAADAGSGERMEIVLMPPRPSGAALGAAPDGRVWRSFTAEEVRAFSADLGDHNAIHQTERPVVSGFQLAAALETAFPALSFSLRFHAPIYAGETVQLAVGEGIIRGYTDRLCFVRHSPVACHSSS